MDSSELFIILIPTISNSIDIDTAFILAETGYISRKRHFIAADNTGGIGAWNTRNKVIDVLKKQLDEHNITYGNTIRALWFDDDICILDHPKKLADMIVEADRQNYNIVANYHNIWKGTEMINTIFKPDLEVAGMYKSLNLEELDSFKMFDLLPEDYVAGLGFYYGDIPLDYKYHAFDKRSKFGEDFNFYRENSLQLRFADVRLEHRKSNVRI